MKYFWAAIVCIVLLWSYKYFSSIRDTVAANATAQVEAQVQGSAAKAEADTAKSVATILAKRPARKAAIKVKQEKDSEAAKAAEQSDPVYAAWADARVPDAVIDRLWVNARPEVGVYSGSLDRQPSPAVRPDSAATAPQTGDRSAIGRLYDFVTGRD